MNLYRLNQVKIFKGTIGGLLVTILLVACNSPEPIVALEALGYDGKTAIIMPNGKMSLKFNQRVTWNTSAGTALQNAQDSLVYTAPANAGVYQLTVKNERNVKDSLVINIVVSPRADVLKPLQKGGYALIFRHAAADVGVDQLSSTAAEWWKSCDSKLARQLNDQGKKDAVAIGKAIKNLQIPVGRVFGSEFCRCYTTADLMNFGLPTQQSKDLTYYVYDEPNRYANTMKLSSVQPIDAQNSVFVIHAGFSTVPSPAPLNSLAWGDAAVFKLGTGQTTTYVSTVTLTEWRELGK
jgi:phosphohistidine phosphatase SixA